ncbi:hypothetical protein MUP77_24795 [Candidatus Bathyarchaeota archaeon]|nr:hypothetical protein [Candidatus Bathyarchaeota archaeon]
MESRCRQIRMEVMEQKYANNPAFHRAKESLEELTREVMADFDKEQIVLGCYGKHLDQLTDTLNFLTMERIREQYAKLKSDVFSTSMAFFSSFSEQLVQFEKEAKARLRGLPREMKTQLLGYIRDWWIENAYPTLQTFVDKLDNVAKLLRVEHYSVSLNFGLIGVEFEFKTSI